jgi:cell division protein FtsQ
MRVSIAAAFVMALSFALILVYDLATQSAYFKADYIEVSGATRLLDVDVCRCAQLKKGVNILSINLSTVRKRLLSHPLIAKARVKRQLPSKILISIREHQPLAVLDLGRKFVINANGEIFSEADAAFSTGLPVISGLEFSDINIAGRPHSNAFRSVMAVLRLGQSRSSVLPIDAIKQIHVDRELGLTLRTTGKCKAVRLGYDDFHIKYDRLESILYYLDLQPAYRDLDSIDLNNLNRVIINPSNSRLSRGGRKEA